MAAGKTIDDCILYIQAQAGKIPGMRQAPARVEDMANAFPFVQSYPAGGNFAGGNCPMVATHDIITEIHVARKDAPRDLSQVMPYLERFARSFYYDSTTTLADATLGGNARHFDTLNYSFVTFDWGGFETVGFRFTFKGVKIMD